MAQRQSQRHRHSQRQRRNADVCVPVDALASSGSGAGDGAVVGVAALREMLAISEVSQLAAQAARDGRLDVARGLLTEMREATEEAVLAYGRMGYDVRQVGLDYVVAVGGQNFSGAQAVREDSTPIEVASAVIDSTVKAWDSLGKSVGSQVQVQVQVQAHPHAHPHAHPQVRAGALSQGRRARGTKPPEKAVIDVMAEVWGIKTGELVRGGRIEELASGVGLRTLNELLERFGGADARGGGDAAPKASLWVWRAYWLTKHSVQHLYLRPEFVPLGVRLREIGLGYEDALGGHELAGLSWGKIGAGAKGWEVVRVGQEETAKVWGKLKEIIP